MADISGRFPLDPEYLNKIFVLLSPILVDFKSPAERDSRIGRYDVLLSEKAGVGIFDYIAVVGPRDGDPLPQLRGRQDFELLNRLGFSHCVLFKYVGKFKGRLQTQTKRNSDIHYSKCS